jgi:hypothetical protein
VFSSHQTQSKFKTIIIFIHDHHPRKIRMKFLPRFRPIKRRGRERKLEREKKKSKTCRGEGFFLSFRNSSNNHLGDFCFSSQQSSVTQQAKCASSPHDLVSNNRHPSPSTHSPLCGEEEKQL